MAEEPIDHWAELAEEFEASAEAYNDLCNALRRVFRPAQEEAYESYCAWEQEIEAEGAEVEAPSLDGLLEYAAAASEQPRPTQGEPPQELVAFTLFTTFEVQGIRYEAFRKAGSVFLRPRSMPAKTRLFLNEKGYVLEEVEGDENLYQVVNLRSADLQSFLGRRAKDPNQYQIRFEN